MSLVAKVDYGALARSYSPLLYIAELRSVIATFFPDISLTTKSKHELHQLVNDVLFESYHGEEVLKYKLANLYKSEDYKAAFEVKVNQSRADFLVINGDTKCFEIKSKFDTLKRLEKQSTDYSKVFEFNHILIDEKHLDTALDIIPDYYGIWIFRGQEREVVRSAKYSPNICSLSQISMLTKKERLSYFETQDSRYILNNFKWEEINDEFKKALKQRYSKRWDFLIRNWDEIVPVDLHFFYNTNIKPIILYK